MMRKTTYGSTHSCRPSRARRSTFTTGSDVLHAWIEVHVGEVGDRVHDDEPAGRQEDRRLHDRVVPRLDRLDHEPAHPGPREDRLGDHSAAEKRPELQA